MEQSQSNDVDRLVTILLRWSWLILAGAALAAALAFVVSSMQQPVYQASTTLLIDEAPGVIVGSEPILTTDSERRAQTYSQLLTTEPLLGAVIQRLELPVSVEDLKRAVHVQPGRDSQLIRVEVRYTDPQQAARIANTLVTVFTDEIQQIQASRYLASKENLEEQMASVQQQIEQTESRLADLGDDGDAATRGRLEVALTQYREIYASLLESYERVRTAEAQTTSNLIQVEPAAVPSRPVSPRVLLNTVLAGIVGLLVAAGLVFLREAFDDRVKDPEQLSRQIGLPVLGLVARTGKRNRTRPIVIDQPHSPGAEDFRIVATNLQSMSMGRPLRTVLITSPTPDEGKESVAANLAAALAQNGYRVVLVGADMRRPTLHKQLSVADQGGLSELLVHLNGSLDQMVRDTGIKGLSIITAGDPPPNPAGLVGSKKMAEILDHLQEQADIVLIDAPPVTAVADAAVLAQRVDGVLLAVRGGSTKLATCKQAVEQLRRVGANLLGVVINDASPMRARYGYTYQSYANRQPTNGASRSGKWLQRKGNQKQDVDAR